MSERLELDFFVVGAGSAGVRASRMAASFGATVGVAEEKALGGTCVNVGCVPKQLMVIGSHFAEEGADAAGYGWSVGAPTFDWSTLIANKDREIARLNGVYERLLEGRGVKILRGRARLVGSHEVVVRSPEGEETQVRAETILVATGGQPTRLSIPGAEHVSISDDFFHLPTLPRRVLVVGGGYIAVEFAGLLHGYGAAVTQIYRGALFLRGFDRDVRVHLDAEMRHRGIDLRFHRDLVSVEKLPDGALAAKLTCGSTVAVDAILAAVGRQPNTAGLGLEAVGVETDARGAVVVDEAFRTSVPSIYAVGDVIDRIQLTPVALAEGMIVAKNLFDGKRARADYEFVPSAVFSQPTIATVGLTEEEARASFAIDVYKSTFTPMKQTMTTRKEKTLMKLVVERATDRVVGVHVVGPEAAEIVQGFAVALKCGAKKSDFDATTGIHPTAAEELVTMRERLPDPDVDTVVHHDEPAFRKKIVHRSWD
jgi:glutathione reductase (NADPH)